MTKCSCSAGLDTCTSFGRCVDFCQSAAVVDQITKANSLVTVCDYSMPNACPGSLICEPSPRGVQLTCAAGKISSVLVGGVCSPATRELVNAQFGSTGATISVTLNAAANQAAVACSTIFDNATTALLGSKAWCTVLEKSITIKLDPTSAITPGQSLTVLPGQTVLVDKLQKSAAFSGTVKVQTCLDCAAPKAIITGPQVGTDLKALSCWQLWALLSVTESYHPHAYLFVCSGASTHNSQRRCSLEHHQNRFQPF